MNKIQTAYKHLKENGISQQIIIRRLTKKGIKPARSESYSATKLSRLINENYAPNPDVEKEIILMAKELKV
jgi:UDP-N-acetylmuramyl pentapeptide synthase